MTHSTVRSSHGHLRSRFLALAIAAALGGCGYKGPLYLPSSKPDAAKPILIPAPDPDRPVPAEAAPPPK
jgi:predicted small lipoprotein YifL